MFLSWYYKFSSQPHQPFFTSGILFLLLFLLLFSSSYSNILHLDTTVLTYHAYTMVFVIFIQCFLGFLFVVFPRFLMQAEIKSKVYMNQFHLYLISSLGILFSLIYYSQITILFQIMMLVTQILSFRILYSIHKKSLVKVKEDTKWVLIGFFSGLISHALFLVSCFDFTYSYYLNKFAINSGFYLFLFVIIFAISQRMIPFFTTAKVSTYLINKTKNILLFIYVLLFLKVILLTFENPSLNLLADVPLFILITRELIKWKLPLFKVPAIMWVLYLALYWIPLGFLLSITESIMFIYNPEIIFEKAVIHTFALGYFLTALIGFGTRVILGHSGAAPHADKFAIAIFMAVQLVVVLRILSSLSLNFESGYIILINLSSLALVVGLMVWSSRYLLILLKGK